MRAGAFGCWLFAGILGGLVSPLAYPTPTAEVPGGDRRTGISSGPDNLERPAREAL